MGEAWIIDAVRTPRGKGRKDVGALVHTHPQELMATALRALAARNALDPHDVDDVVVGCVSQAGDQGACIARNAVVPLKTIRDPEIDPEKVNVNGGAIALGHPIGATGAMLLGTVLDEWERRDLATGLGTLYIGGGMGVATIIERL